MRPFFSYYGSKYTGAKHYGKPMHDVVVEPFAGSACYSLYWNHPKVKLYDLSENVVLLWDFLINCSDSDIMAIPDYLSEGELFDNFSEGQRVLLGHWTAKGRAEPASHPSPWYHSHKHLSGRQCLVWGPKVKERILKQKPMIKDWSIDQKSYTDIDLQGEYTWHIDPPYNNYAGSRYPNSNIDYKHLADWCLSRNGIIDVCENRGATWLPFTDLYEVVSSRGRRTGHTSKESVYSNRISHHVEPT